MRQAMPQTSLHIRKNLLDVFNHSIRILWFISLWRAHIFKDIVLRDATETSLACMKGFLYAMKDQDGLHLSHDTQWTVNDSQRST